MSRRRALITGAAGFIGSACLQTLVRNGWEVAALLHQRGLQPAIQALPGVRSFQGSITDPASLRSVFLHFLREGPVDLVLHCAARVTDLGAESHFRRVNLEGTQNLVRCVREFDVPRLLHFSTTDVYGLQDFDGADETTPLAQNADNPYPKYKILSEQVVRDQLSPERRVILRPGVVWGPGDRTILPRILDFLRRSPRIIHFGRYRGGNSWPLAFVGNVAQVALAAANSESPGEVYNVVDPEGTTVEQYYRLILDLFHPERREMVSLTLPYWMGWSISRVSTWLSNFLGRDHPIWDPTLYGLRSVTSNLAFDSRKAGQLLCSAGLDWIPRNQAIELFRESIRSCGQLAPAGTQVENE